MTEIKAFVRKLFLEGSSPNYYFHNFDHIEEVVEICEVLSNKINLSESQKKPLLIAAWFHLTGIHENYDSPVSVSTAIATAFLKKAGHEDAFIQTVQSLIESTGTKNAPTNQLQEVLNDAKWSFLGRKRFFRKVDLLRLELEQVKNQKITSEKWEKYFLDILTNHHFYTLPARDKYEGTRIKNIATQRKNFKKARTKTTRIKTGKEFGRGIDTLYRVTLKSHIDFSNIADGKANMIISINTLILSILITASSAGLSLNNKIFDNFLLISPILILMLTSLMAILFAVFSAIPKVGGQNFEKLDATERHKVSLLFFGNFLRLEKEEFVSYLSDLKKDQSILYDNLSRDLYNLGLVLKKKFRLLNISYWIFIGGLIFSLFVFLLVFFVI